MASKSRLAVAAAVIAVFGGSSLALRSQTTQPWLEPQNSAQAIVDPDAYAWQLFVALNWPANMEKRSADSNKRLGESGPVVWESWKSASDIFLQGGVDPGNWFGAATGGPTVTKRFDSQALQQFIRQKMLGGSKIMFEPGTSEGGGNETRMNQAAFEFVRSNKLFSKVGQIALANSGVETINFPIAAKEVKAQWRVINEADKSRYHWVEQKLQNGSIKIYGLTALHITTKDVPNWLWATFEHVDNPSRLGNEA